MRGRARGDVTPSSPLASRENGPRLRRFPDPRVGLAPHRARSTARRPARETVTLRAVFESSHRPAGSKGSAGQHPPDPARVGARASGRRGSGAAEGGRSRRGGAATSANEPCAAVRSDEPETDKRVRRFPRRSAWRAKVRISASRSRRSGNRRTARRFPGLRSPAREPMWPFLPLQRILPVVQSLAGDQPAAVHADPAGRALRPARCP